MNQPKVTVIIVVYNAEEIRNIFKECLDSSLNLKYDNYEVIVVNNGSTDRTKEILKDYEKDLRIINLKKNIGISRARNIAYENSKSEFVLLLDSDVIAEQDSLKELVKLGINNSKIGALGGIQVDYNKNRITCLGRLIEVNIAHIIIDSMPSVDEVKESYYSYIPGAYLLVRRKSIGNTLHPKEFFMYVEDIELCFRIWSRGYYVKLIPIVACRHEFQTSVRSIASIEQNMIIKKLNYSYHKNLALLTTIYKRYLPNIFLLHVFSKLLTLPIIETLNFPAYALHRYNYNYVFALYYPLINLTYLKYYMRTISTINEYGENIPLLINIKGSWKYLFKYFLPIDPSLKLNYHDSIIKDEDIIRSGRKFLITKKI
jgi:GT2 family glycosyltransferase